MDPLVIVAVLGLVVAAFNVWLVFRFVSFMDLVERRLGAIAEHVTLVDKQIASAAIGANVRIEAVVSALEKERPRTP